MRNLVGTDSPPASPRGFWMHTNFEMQGQYLVAKCYLVAIDTPVFFEMKLDTTPIVKAIREGHSDLHAGNGPWAVSHSPEPNTQGQVAGEGIPVNLVGGAGNGIELVGGAGNGIDIVGSYGIDIVGSYGIDIVGAAKSIMVNRVANATQAITKQIASQPSILDHRPSNAKAAYAAANSLLASIEKQRLIDQAANHTAVAGGAISEQVESALPQLQAMVRDGRTATHIVGAVISSASGPQPTAQSQRTAAVLKLVHDHRNHLRALGQHGSSTGRVVDENGNIRNRIANPIPTVSQAVPQLAAAVSGIDHLSTLVGGHADIVGGSCVGCGCIGCY